MSNIDTIVTTKRTLHNLKIYSDSVRKKIALPPSDIRLGKAKFVPRQQAAGKGVISFCDDTSLTGSSAERSVLMAGVAPCTQYHVEITDKVIRLDMGPAGFCKIVVSFQNEIQSYIASKYCIQSTFVENCRCSILHTYIDHACTPKREIEEEEKGG